MPSDEQPLLRSNRWTLRAGLVALGAGAALGQAPTHLWWLTVLVLACWLFLSARIDSRRDAFGHGFWFGLGYFAVALRWIVSPFMVDVARDGWMAPFAIVFLSAGLAAIWGGSSWLAWRFGRGRMLAFAAWLTGAEVLRSLVLTGFPWALIGHVWVGTPVDQLAARIGPHGLTALTTILAWALARAAAGRWTLLALPVAVVPFALWLSPGPVEAPSDSAAVVRLVQPNAPQDQKWDIDKRHIFFERMLDYTGTDPRPELIVWPETALPDLLEWAGASLGEMDAAAGGVPVITGINRREGPRYFNALVLMGQGGAIDAIYDKAHLVPFGEYFPGGEVALALGLSGFAASEGRAFSTGGAQPLIELPGIGPARALICYEGIFAEEIGTPERPRLLLLITNDAWFGKGAGPAQHLAQARLRSIEQGLPMVRVANTGISAMIDGRGRIVESLALGEAGYIDAPLPAALAPPPYTRFGDWPVVLLLLAALMALAIFRRPA